MYRMVYGFQLLNEDGEMPTSLPLTNMNDRNNGSNGVSNGSGGYNGGDGNNNGTSSSVIKNNSVITVAPSVELAVPPSTSPSSPSTISPLVSNEREDVSDEEGEEEINLSRSTTNLC